MLTKEQYQEYQIKSLLSRLNSLFGTIQHLTSIDPQDFQVEIHEAEQNFKGNAKLLFNVCSAYLEGKGLPFYFKLFQDKITPYYIENKTLNGSYVEEADEILSELTAEYWQILHAFPAFGDISTAADDRGLVYLEHILDSTGVIIKNAGIVPTSEKSVYDAVKAVCQAVFSDFTHPTQSFQKTAKCYVPDILIPSLRCAIEYKYATTEARLIETIDQILVDVQGYSGNPSYNIFYAVFYVTPGIWTRKRFLEVWKEKGFLKNWKGIFVEGN